MHVTSLKTKKHASETTFGLAVSLRKIKFILNWVKQQRFEAQVKAHNNHLGEPIFQISAA